MHIFYQIPLPILTNFYPKPRNRLTPITLWHDNPEILATNQDRKPQVRKAVSWWMTFLNSRTGIGSSRFDGAHQSSWRARHTPT